MSKIKLQNIDGELGFNIPKEDLALAGFDESSDYEVIAKKDILILVKKHAHNSNWIFNDPALSVEDEFWLESSEF